MIRLIGNFCSLLPFKLLLNVFPHWEFTSYPGIKKGIFLGFLLFPSLSYAQINSFGENTDRREDSLNLSMGMDNLNQVFKNRLRENLKIYSGSEFIFQNKAIKGSPFLDGDFIETDIFFEDYLYRKVPAKFDLNTGQLVIQDYFNKNLIEINRQKVPYFIRNHNLFVRMMPDSDINRNLKEGIYELIWNKKISIYVLREKISGNVSGVGVFENAFLEYDHYFMKIGQGFYPCDDMNAFLKNIPDHKTELKEYIRSQKPFSKQDFEGKLLVLARKYADLKMNE